MKGAWLYVALTCATVGVEAESRISPLKIIRGANDAVSYLETPIDRYCNNSPTEVETEARRDVSVGRANQTPRSPSDFFSAEYLNVSIECDRKVCTPESLEAIGQTLIKSLALWRSGCSRCRAEKLIAVSVNGALWIDHVTLDKWRYGLKHGLSKARVDPKGASRMNLRPFGFQPLVDFHRVDVGDLNADLCLAARRYVAGSDLQFVICKQPTSSCRDPRCLKLPVRVGWADTCSLTGRIACGSPDRELALNIEEQGFVGTLETSDGKQSVTFGAKNEVVDLLRVLTHETGHWFGLAHEKEGADLKLTSVMRDAYDPEAEWCITEWNLVQVDNAVDKGWKARLKTEHGLVWKR